MTAAFGVFDSGVGGLGVVSCLRRRLPNIAISYVADQAHVPYGGRDLTEVRGFAGEISSYLRNSGCGAIVMACNISSAVALNDVRIRLAPIPVYGMIEAVAHIAGRASGAIAVLATQGTVASGAYSSALHRLAPRRSVIEIACPDLVPLVEAGELESDSAFAAVCGYLAQAASAHCGTVILGCTHYPFLLPTLCAAARSLWHEVPLFLDPAHALADQIAQDFPDLAAERCAGPDPILATTGDEQHFLRQATRFLSSTPNAVTTLQWLTDGGLAPMQVRLTV